MELKISDHYILGLKDIKKYENSTTYRVLIAALYIGMRNPEDPCRFSISATEVASLYRVKAVNLYNKALRIRENLIKLDWVKTATYDSGRFEIILNDGEEKKISSEKNIRIDSSILGMLKTAYSISLYEEIKRASRKTASPAISVSLSDLTDIQKKSIYTYEAPIRVAANQINEHTEYAVEKVEFINKENRSIIYTKLK